MLNSFRQTQECRPFDSDAFGADGAGSTSGILKAEDPVKRVEEMVLAEMEAMKER
ncbi:MAG: hypothetical protein KBS83_07055 [Lachnospiraceae bacterium]|nr:hypothetical protein [Candidatus Equihabitans merdae]